jgi:hypothetical protein
MPPKEKKQKLGPGTELELSEGLPDAASENRKGKAKKKVSNS